MKFTFQPETRPLDGYTIKRAIDRGSFGEVYYALSDAGKEVALKLLKTNQDIELRGVTQCLNLKHPNLLNIFDIRTDGDGDHWVVMEYVAGRNLEKVLAEHPQGLPMEQVQRWLLGAAAGLSFLHDRGVVHRDVKPGNIFMDQGVVKIGDVGLSKFMTPSRRSAHTESVGTVYYMAPEVAHGRYGAEVDVYSLAIILYEMLTGRVPFDGESTAEILMKHLSQAPDLRPIPERLRSVLARALEKDPQRRTPGVAQLAEEFGRAVRGEPAAAEPRQRQVPPTRSRCADWRTDWRSARHRRRVAVRQKVRAEVASFVRGTGDFCHRRPLACVVGLIALLVIGSDFFFIARHSAHLLFHLARFFAWGLALIAIPLATLYYLGRFGVWMIRELFDPRVGTGPNEYGRSHSNPAPYAPPSEVPDRETYSGPGPRAAQFERKNPAEVPVRVVASPQPRQPRAPWANLSTVTRRKIPFRQRLADCSVSMALTPVLTLLFLGVLHTLTPLFGTLATHSLDLGRAGLFGFTTIAAAWAILILGKSMEGNTWNPTLRRLTYAGVGAGVGLFAFWLDRTLLVDLYVKAADVGSLFQPHVRRPLIAFEPRPVLTGYVVFFALLFGLRGWWRQVDAFRPRQFRTWTFLISGGLGFLIAVTCWAFPQSWAMGWAAAISAVVQLAAIWIPPEERLARYYPVTSERSQHAAN